MVKQINHPLIFVKMTRLRDKTTPHEMFRKTVHEVSALLAYEVFKKLPVKLHEVVTPMELPYQGGVVSSSIVLAPILRAGLGMVEGFLQILPEARTGHIGLYRDEKNQTIVDYFFRLPIPQGNLDNVEVIILEPMLATGRTILIAINRLIAEGYKNITVVSLIISQKAVNYLTPHLKGVNIFTAAIDPDLDANNFILPGLGDAGDRIFGSK